MKALFLSFMYTLLLGTVLEISPLYGQQALSKEEKKKFEKAEIALKAYSDQFLNDSLSFEDRLNNIHAFIPRFVAILKEKNSFYYPFDGLTTISKIQPSNDAFRIFTWKLKEPLGTHRYYGAIQMQGSDIQLFPLFDHSDTMAYRTQAVLSADNWYGSMYYNCVYTTDGHKDYYTLFGLDELDFVSNQKVMEVMTFNASGEPVFGEISVEYYDSSDVLIDTKQRLFLEYNERAIVRMNYDEEMEMILYDHLIPPTDQQEGAHFTYLPDGSYEGLIWGQGKWIWQEKIFNHTVETPPMPFPILDDRD